MKKRFIFLLCATLLTMVGCSRENAKRIGYETVRNIGQQQCLKDYSADCPERDSYNEYERKREEAKSSR
jgi:hypothetical protein